MGKYSDQFNALLDRHNLMNDSYNHIMNCFGYLMDDNSLRYNEAMYKSNSQFITDQISEVLPFYIEEQVKEAYSKMMDDFTKSVSKQSEQIGKSISDGISKGFKKAGLK